MIVLILLFFCHYLADFTHLSRPYMLKAKAAGTPLMPIFHHAAVHAILMGAVIWATYGLLAGCLSFVIEIITHFCIDILKGRLNTWLPNLRDTRNPYHWYVFAADQLLHTLVILSIWKMLVA